MSVELRRMSEAEYAAWRPHAEREYGNDMIRAGMPEAQAREKGERDFAALLPQGVDSPGHDLYTVTRDGDAVGVLWLSERDGDGAPMLFIYDIVVDEAYRGQGLGRATMELVEDEAKRRDIGTVALNVFGGNDVARNLYRSLGYDEIAIWMTKRV